MQQKLAILQVADQGPLESLVVMLRAAGYRCAIPDRVLRSRLRDIGCDTVLAPKDLSRQFGYDAPFDIDLASTGDMFRCDLFVDIKAHRSYSHLIREWPRLERRVLWYRINGGKPEHVVNERGDHGDEINPPCPVLTPNRWYAERDLVCEQCDGNGWFDVPAGEFDLQTGEGRLTCDRCFGQGSLLWTLPRYACWPPFVRFDDYGRAEPFVDQSICLIHNLEGWGYGRLIEPFTALGVRMYGRGSPSGLVEHQAIPPMLAKAKAMVHLKSSDAPGYALYEAMAASCPIICTRRLIWRCRMQDLLVPGETCFVFDRETHDPLSDQDVIECTAEVKQHLDLLSNPEENRRIGQAGHERLKQLMWRENRDLPSLVKFLSESFA